MELKTLPRIRFENSRSVAHFCDLFVTRISLASWGFWLMIKWSSHSLSLCFARAMYFCQRTTKTKKKKIIPIGSHVNQRDSHLQKGAGLRGFIVLTDKAEWRWERIILLSARLVLFLSYLAWSDIFYCQLSLGTKRTVDTRFTFFPLSFLLPFTSQQYCHRERIECSSWKIITSFFIVWHHQLSATPPPSKASISHGSQKKRGRGGGCSETESQSEIEKSMWRRLAWMHLQALLMTADSFLQPLLQSQSNIFIFFLCAAPSQKSSVILCSLRNWMYREARHDSCNLCCRNTYSVSFDVYPPTPSSQSDILPHLIFLHGFHWYVNVMIWSRTCERMPFRAFCRFGSYTLVPLLFLAELQYFRYSFTQF